MDRQAQSLTSINSPTGVTLSTPNRCYPELSLCPPFSPWQESCHCSLDNNARCTRLQRLDISGQLMPTDYLAPRHPGLMARSPANLCLGQPALTPPATHTLATAPPFLTTPTGLVGTSLPPWPRASETATEMTGPWPSRPSTPSSCR